MDKQKGPQRTSLYKDLFGDDLSVVAEAYDSPWASREQQALASQLLGGQKSIHSLSTPELELLDDLAVRYNDQGGDHEAVHPVDVRLPVPDDDGDVGEDDQELQSSGGDDVQHDTSPDLAGAYGWLSDDGEGGGGK